MAFFGVTKEKIASIIPCPNSDFLDICRLENLSFQFVVKKDQWKVGDECLYLPVDAIVPETILEQIGLKGKLSGKNKNRVKTIELRKQISQGIIIPTSFIDGLADSSQEAITKFLGIEKYEPEEIIEASCRLLPLKLGLSPYDIEGCERFPITFARLMDIPVVISEKLEGRNSSISYDWRDKKIYVNQKNFTILELEDKTNTWWNVFRKNCLIEKMEQIYLEVAKLKGTDEYLTIYGETIGPAIQENIYKLKTHSFVCFDIKYGNRYLGWEDFKNITKAFDVTTVPILAENMTLKAWLDGKTIYDASNGKSLLFDTLREGVVIKPVDEEYSEELRGRCFLKQRSPKYLAKTEN